MLIKRKYNEAIEKHGIEKIQGEIPTVVAKKLKLSPRNIFKNKYFKGGPLC